MRLPKRFVVKYRGFTLTEIIIALGIFLLLILIGLPIGWNFYLTYQLSAEQELFKSVLRQAQSLAMINRHESPYGVYIDSNNFIIFEGVSFAARVPAEDRYFPRSSNILISGPSELIFEPLSGRTASSTLALSNGRQTLNLFINVEGSIND